MSLACPVCGATFEPHNARQKYCGEACLNAARREFARQFMQRRQEAVRAERLAHPKVKACRVCGAEFPVSRGRKYCSAECAEEANRVNMKAYRKARKETARNAKICAKHEDHYQCHVERHVRADGVVVEWRGRPMLGAFSAKGRVKSC